VDYQKLVYTFFISAFLLLWAVFLFRENKRGEYAELRYLYAHNDIEKRRFVMGASEYDYLAYCKETLPANATYRIIGLEDIALVRARYMLWPARVDLDKPDFLLVFKSHYSIPQGYAEFKKFQGDGYILKREVK